MKEWYSAKDLSEVAGMPNTVQGINKKAKSENWQSRKREGRGGGNEYHLSSLPAETQAALLKKQSMPKPAKPKGQRFTLDSESLWNRYDRAPESMKEQAHKRVEALALYRSLVDNGITKSQAAETVAKQYDANRATVYRWLDKVKGLPGQDWPAALLSGYTGRTKEADFTPEAWEFFKADYLRLEQPSVAACYDRLQRTAENKGWQIPACRTVERWVTKNIPDTVRVLMREGELALMRRYPSIERTVKGLYATQWINGDGYQHNVFVRFPDGTIDRPKTWFWQDVFSRKTLAYRIDRTENTDTIRLSFGDLVEQFGVPEHVTIDNTRAAANKWMTGGTPNRYRFKVKEDDPMGIFTLLGVQVHWTSVNKAGTQAKGHGQAKPIERSFGVGGLGEYIDKHPDFSGAYTGENPTAKPENYGEKAIPLEQFVRVVNEEIIAWNARTGRRTEMGGGIFSFDQVFKESYEAAAIKKATEAQRRLWLLAAESITVKQDGTFTLMAGAKVGQRGDGRNRYFAPALQEFGERRQKIVVRFDPDNLHQEAFAYTLDGRFIAKADCIEALGFGDTTTSRAVLKARRQFIKATKQAAEAELRMDLAQVSEHLPRPNLPDTAAAKVVRPHRPAQQLQPPQQQPELAARAQAAMATIHNHQPEVAPETAQQRYQRWQRVDHAISNGEQLDDKQKRWWETYQTTSEFRAQQRMEESFGQVANAN